MMKFEISVTQVVEVTLDETKFDETFMEEFRSNFYPFHELEDHAKHIAQLYARGLYGGTSLDFVEGYGYLNNEMGASVKEIEQYEDVQGVEKLEWSKI